MSGFIQRAVTAIVFVLVMVGGVYGHPISHIGLFVLITAFCLWEYFGLTLGKKDGNRKWLGVIVGLLPIILLSSMAINTNSPAFTLNNSLLLLLPAIGSIFLYELFQQSEQPYTNIGVLLSGFLYIGIPFALIPLITFTNGLFQPNIVFGLLLLTWANDTGAYLIGSQIGRTKLFPRISPKKTWEGSLGGVIVTVIVGYLLSTFFTDLNVRDWLVLSGIVAIFGSLGDLVESMLKRSLNIKDSGNLLPGHGGFLDRFDAFLFLLPFAAAYLLWNS